MAASVKEENYSVSVSEGRPAGPTVIKLAWCCLLAGVVAAGLMFPVAGGLGLLSNRASDVVANGSAQLLTGDVPQVSTMVDAAGNPIAWIFTQRRWVVPGDRIADTMKLAIVSIEDKRFGEHNGVDWQGSLTGLAGYLHGAVDTRGGSTIEQQYVKNYQLAGERPERRGAAGGSRDHPDAQAARDPDGSGARQDAPKAEILTRYLNLLSFGNGSFGVQEAARTYFGVNAAQLNWQQAALLAGMVQSTSTLNPYTNPEGALARRNLVLDTLIENLPDKADELRAAKATAAGHPAQAQPVAAGLHRGGRSRVLLRLRAVLSRARGHRQGPGRAKRLSDPHHARPEGAGLRQAGDRRDREPDLHGVASVMSVIKPGKDAHRVLAMADNRTYGLELGANRPCSRSRSHPSATAPVDLQDLHHRRGARHGHGHQRPTRRPANVPRRRAWATAIPRAVPRARGA